MLHPARLAQVQFGLALLALLVLLGAIAWRNTLGRSLPPDVVVPEFMRGWRIGSGQPLLRGRWRTRARWALDGGLALAALFVALASMTSATTRGFGLDHSALLHEGIQAKYHGELGWTDLYTCTVAADRDREGDPVLRGIQKVRQIGPTPHPPRRPGQRPEWMPGGRPAPRAPAGQVGGKMLPVRAAIAAAGCRERFDDARWAALQEDLSAIAEHAPEGAWTQMVQGHGSTATPARLARQRVVFSLVPLSAGGMFALTLFAGIVVLGALALVGLAWSLRVAAIVGLACFVEFAATPLVTGASPSLYFVLAFALAGFAALKLERWALGGALLVVAALDQPWLATAVVAVAAKLGAGTRPRWSSLARFAAGAVGAGVLVTLSCLSLPGGLVDNWTAWLERVETWTRADASRQVGLRWLFAPDGNLLEGPRIVPYPLKAERIAERQDWLQICAVLLVVPVLLALRRLPVVAFACIGAATFTFAMFSVDGSVWSVALPLLVLAAGAIGGEHEPSRLLRGRPATVLAAGCFALTVGMHGIFRIHQRLPWLFNTIYSHLLAALFLGLGVTLLVLPGLRERGDDPGGPEVTPVLASARGGPSTLSRLVLGLLGLLRRRGRPQGKPKPEAPTRRAAAKTRGEGDS